MWYRNNVVQFNWTVTYWGKVIFTVESRFSLKPNDKRDKIHAIGQKLSQDILHSDVEATWL